jgi:tetratricopeptide (TPR) repeat protein
VSAILLDSQTGQYVWSWNVDRDLTTASLVDIEADIASRVAGAIAQPYGIVFDRTVREAASKPAESLASYECVAMFRQYWRSYNERDFDTVHDCLERSIETDPQYAWAYSSLALLYVDTYRFGSGRGKIAFDPLQRAWQLAEKAIQLEPNSSESYLALSMVYWFSNDIDKGIQAAQRGLALNPHNTDLLAELGFRYALLAKWDLAMPLISEAYARNPGSPTGYHIATFLNAYMHGDYPQALEEALQADAPYVLYGHIARAMAYGKLGDKAKAAAAVSAILQIDPDYAAHVTDDLAKRHVDPGIIQAVVDGLIEAGLPAK